MKPIFDQMTKNTRIVMVSRFPRDPNNPRGGVESATVGLARAIADFGGVDLHIITLEHGLKKTVRETHDGIHVHRLVRSSAPMMLDIFLGRSARRLKKYLKNLNPGIVHFHESWGLGSSRYSWPTVFTVHGFDSLNLPAEKRLGWKFRSQLWQRLERYGLRRQKFLISIAPYVRNKIESMTSCPIYDIWNPLDKRYFEIRRKEEPGYILFLGWLNSRKNPVVIVEAVESLKTRYPDLRVELCGEASDSEYFKILNSKIKAYGLEKNISLPGRLSQQQVMERLSRACMLLLPSLQENAPMVVAEAMSAGVPVIGANLCGIPDMLEQGNLGILVDPNDVGEIAQAIEFLLKDSNVRRKFSQAAKKSAIKKFHPKNVASSTFSVYRQAMVDYYGPDSEQFEGEFK